MATVSAVTIVRRAHVDRLLLAGIVGRIPSAVTALAVGLVLRSEGWAYDRVAVALGVGAVGLALGVPALGRVVDRRGQRASSPSRRGVEHRVRAGGRSAGADLHHRAAGGRGARATGSPVVALWAAAGATAAALVVLAGHGLSPRSEVVAPPRTHGRVKSGRRGSRRARIFGRGW